MKSGYLQAVFQKLTQSDTAILNVETDTLFFHDNDAPIDNILVKGITFTGTLLNAGPFPGTSVMFSHPSNNATFADCHWVDMIAPIGLLSVFQNDFQQALGVPVADHSIHLSLVECRFARIDYDRALIHVKGQNLTIHATTFSDVNVTFLSSTAQDCDYTRDNNTFANGCAGLLYCASTSFCEVRDTCIEDFEYQGPGLFHSSHSASVDIDNVYHVFYSNFREATAHSSEGCDWAVLEPNQLSVCRDVLQGATTCPAFY